VSAALSPSSRLISLLRLSKTVLTMATKGDMQQGLDGFTELSQVEAALEVDNVSAPIAAYSRGKKLSVAVLGVAAVIFGTALAAKHFGTEGSKFVDYVPFSHPAFVNYVATDVHPDYALFPRQCDPAIVLDVCQRLNEETVEFYGSALDTNVNYVHALEISQAFSVAKSSVVDLFHRLDLKNKGDVLLHPNSFAVSCQELCEALVGSFPEKDLPGRSDVGCYKSPVTHKVVCNQDVSEAAINRIMFSTPAADEKGDYLETGAMKQFNKGGAGSHQQMDDKALKDAMSPSAMEFGEIEALTYPEISFHVLKVTVINLFRIYPKLESSVLDETGLSKFIGQSKEPNLGGRRLLSSSDTCNYAKDGGCDEPTYCAAGTDCTDCNTCHIDLSAGWKETTLQLAVKAKAYVSTALKNMNGRHIDHIVTKWFGNYLDYPTRQEIKRVLVGIDELLGNVNYEYPGDQCQANTYAYVYQQAPWNKNANGQYIFHLCDVYIRANEGEKIETLTHEGSHHLTMQTDDAKYKSQTMYGRALCEEVAKACATGDQRYCTKARTNADSYCYFINDAALANGAVAKTSSPTNLNTALQSGQASSGGAVTEVAGADGMFASLR